MEKLKLSCKGYHFNKKDNVITCHIKVYNTNLGYYNEVTGKSICSPDDEFDEVLGRRMARSRAERDAFAQFHGWLIWKGIPKELDKVAAMQDAADRMAQYVEHQREYINSL